MWKKLKVAVLFSGGKDSTFALWWSQMQGWDIASLVTVFPESPESWMFHYPALKWTKLQAQIIGIPQAIIRTKGEKDNELSDLSLGLEKLRDAIEIDTIVSGAVASEYQKTRIDNICEQLGLKSIAPLWHKNAEQLVREEIESGFEIILTACNALGLDQSWLGKVLGTPDVARLSDLRKKYGVNPVFEGGEAETFVLSGPAFSKRLRVILSTPIWRGSSGHLELEDVRLVD